MLDALGEQYEVLAELGEGGFGRVYSVRDRRSGMLLAVKTINRPDPLRLSLLKQEARVVGGIVHPNLVTLHGLQQAGDQLFLTMELVNGVRLDSYVAYGRELFTKTDDIDADTAAVPQHLISLSRHPPRTGDLGGPIGEEVLCVAPASSLRWRISTVELDGPAPVEAAKGPVSSWAPEKARLRDSMSQLATAVVALHSIGRIHRDIKPDNVLVERDGRVVLLDFGLALALDVVDSDGVVVGTPGFMAPEQIRGERCSAATDWFSFGAVLHLLVHGEPPYPADAGALTRLARGEELPPAPPCPPELDELASLARRLLRVEPDDRPGADEVLALLRPDSHGEGTGLATTRRVAALREWASRTGPLLVGREAELSRLEQAWDKVLAGQPAVAAVHGPSGIGTTTLVDAFCATRRDTFILVGRCYENESMPYAGWDSLVDALAEALVEAPPWTLESASPAEAAALLRLFPILVKVRAVVHRAGGASPPADPVELRNAAFDGLIGILGALAEGRRTIVRLDDLHRADPSSAAMVLRLFETLPAGPLLLLLSWNDAESAPGVLRRLSATERCEDLVLGPLGSEDCRDLAERLLPPRLEGRAELTDRIASQSGGLPLFVSELALAAAQGIDGSGDLETLVRRRAAALPDEAGALLGVVAAARRPVALRTAAELARSSSPNLAARVLVAEHLVRSSGAIGGVTVECFNHRIGDALRRRQDEEWARNVLLGLAERTSADEDPEAKGRYLYDAGEIGAAAPLLQEAATRAREAFAFERADELLLFAEPGIADAVTRRECAWARATCLAAVGKGPAAAAQYLAAADPSDPEQTQECQRLATLQLVRAGRFVQARSLLHDVMDRAGMRMPRGSLWTLVRLLYHRFAVRLRGLGFRVRSEAEVPIDLRKRIDTEWIVAQGLALFAPVSAACIQARNLRRSLQAGERGRVARSLAVEAGFRSTLGGRWIRQGEQLLERSIRACEGLDLPRVRAIQLIAQSILAFQAGRWGTSQTFAEQAADLVRTRCRDAGWELGTALIYQLTTLSLQGEHARVVRLLPLALRAAVDRGDVHTELHLRLSQPIPLSCVLDRPEEGREEVLAAWKRWGGLEWGLLELYALRHLTLIALYQRDYAEARSRIDELWPGLARSPTRYVAVTTLFARATRLRVALLGLARAETGADRHLKRDMAALGRSGMAWARAEVLAARAQLALLAGADPVEQMSSAASLFASAGQRAHAEVTRMASAGRPADEVDDLSSDWLREQGVRAPGRLVRMLLPAVP